MKNIDCYKCKHFFITWNENAPRGCKAFGFKTKRLPSVVVQENSGYPCQKFLPKFPPKAKKKKTGWKA